MKNNIPKHIGIIPDGNRRWACEHNFSKQDGYYYGLEPGLQLLRMAKNFGIEELSFYGFTVDNCKRPKVQVEAFRNACVKAVDILSNEGCELLVVGNYNSDCFPKQLLPFCERTKINGGGIKLNFLVNYGWKWDLSHIKECGLHWSHDISRIDMIIRWGGMRRLSGFLPIQSVYADFYIVDKYWPDYCDEDFIEALEWYKNQDVTLGG